MLMLTGELIEALGVATAEFATGATWLLASEGGRSVTAQIVRDRDDGSFTASVVESRPDDGSESVAWVSGRPVGLGFEIEGRDFTGESANPEDPRGAAVAFRRQLQAIRASLGGRKVA